MGKCGKTPGAPHNGDCPTKDLRLARPQNPIGAARSSGLKNPVALMSSARTEPAWIMVSDGDCTLRSAIRIASFHRFVWNARRLTGQSPLPGGLGKCGKTPGAPHTGSGDCPTKISASPDLKIRTGRLVRLASKPSRLDIVRSNRAPHGDCERWRLRLQLGHTNCFVPPLCLEHQAPNGTVAATGARLGKCGKTARSAA